MGLPKIPQYYRRKGYQRFFGGLILGFIGGWLSFILNFGGLEEYYITEIKRLKLEKQELENQNKALLEDPVRQNEENAKKLLVEEVIVEFDSATRENNEQLTLLNLQNIIKADLELVLQKDVESVWENRKLLQQLLESKVYKIDDENYRIKVSEFHLYKKLVLYLTATQMK